MVLVWVHEANGSLGMCPQSGLLRPKRWSANFASIVQNFIDIGISV